MKILILTATYLPSTNGVAICISLQKSWLEKLGHEVFIVAPHHPNQIKEKNVIRLPSIHNPLDSDYPILLPIPNREFFQKIPKQVDIIYLQHPFIIGTIGQALSKYYKCPTIFYYHTQYEAYVKVYSMNLIPQNFIKTFTRKSLSKFLNETNHIIVGSETIANLLKRDKIKTSYSIIPITRDFELPEKIDLNLKKESLGLSNRNKIVLVVSRIATEKNIGQLIKIWKSIKEKNGFSLVLVGEGSQKKYLENNCKNDHSIVFLGKVPYSKIYSIYLISNIFIFPSKTEVQPGVIFEAMLAGLPIIAFNAPGPKDFTIHGINSLLANNNNELKKYLIELMKNPKLRNNLGKASRQISKKYKLEKSIQEIEKLFLEIINKYKRSNNRNS